MTRGAQLAFLMATAGGLISCAPWTVRPIGSGEKTGGGQAAALTPAEYVDAIWPARVKGELSSHATDARTLLNALAASPAEAKKRFGRQEANGPVYFLVQGKGVVTAVDTRSRVGLLLVDVAPFDQKPDISIQIGPVLRGNALRDATGLVRFSDFVNQLQFADAGIELNNRVLRDVLAGLEAGKWKGRVVSFAGALAAREEAEPALAELLPVELKVEARP